jgi:hypothetical protein
VAQETNSSSSYLEFSSYAPREEPSRYETYPYNFTVEPVLHYLSVATRPVKRVAATGTINATANLATGLPAPDRLAFNLYVTWPPTVASPAMRPSSVGVSPGSSSRFRKRPMAKTPRSRSPTPPTAPIKG